MRTTPPAYDAAAALAVAGGNAAIARQLLGLFRTELPQQAARLRALHAAGDLAGLREGVHRLAGSARYCGAPALFDACQTLETRLLADRTEVGADVERVMTEIERFQQAAPAA